MIRDMERSEFGHSGAEGQKSYWERFHRDVSVTKRPWLNVAKFGASGGL
jgi:hypothetical protein